MTDRAIAAAPSGPDLAGIVAIADLEVGCVEQARSGSRDAFERLYRRHVGRVYALCLRMTADPARAEEGTQETFIRAWRKLESLRGANEFGAWLRRVAVNVVLGDDRMRRRRRGREEPFGERDRPAMAAAPAAAGLDLERAIAGLPTGARRVFVLHDVEGYGHPEIAEMMGVAAGTSKAQLHRARRLLREALSR